MATSQHELVHRLLDRKTEPLVSVLHVTALLPLASLIQTGHVAGQASVAVNTHAKNLCAKPRWCCYLLIWSTKSMWHNQMVLLWELWCIDLLWQDKLVLRVKTANDEVAHLKEFDYGELLSCRFALSKVSNAAFCFCVLRLVYTLAGLIAVWSQCTIHCK